VAVVVEAEPVVVVVSVVDVAVDVNAVVVVLIVAVNVVVDVVAVEVDIVVKAAEVVDVVGKVVDDVDIDSNYRGSQIGEMHFLWSIPSKKTLIGT